MHSAASEVARAMWWMCDGDHLRTLRDSLDRSRSRLLDLLKVDCIEKLMGSMGESRSYPSLSPRLSLEDSFDLLLLIVTFSLSLSFDVLLAESERIIPSFDRCQTRHVHFFTGAAPDEEEPFSALRFDRLPPPLLSLKVETGSLITNQRYRYSHTHLATFDH